MAPLLGVGLAWDSGSRYFDTANFDYLLAVRPRAGLVTTVKLGDTARGIIEIDVPWAITLSPQQGSHFTPLAGGGAEIWLGGDMSALVLAQIGVDAIKEPGGVLQLRVGWQLKLGLGFRLF